MSLIAVAVRHLHCYEDANELTTCLDECAHSGRAAATDVGGVIPPSIPATGASPLFPGVSRCTALIGPWRSGHPLWKD